MKIQKLLLSLTLALGVLFSVGCAPKGAIKIETVGGHEIELKIKVPRKFKNDKKLFTKFYAFTYMNFWNEGVSESEGNRDENKFFADAYAKQNFTGIHDSDKVNEIAEYFETKESIFNEAKKAGRKFGNKNKN